MRKLIKTIFVVAVFSLIPRSLFANDIVQTITPESLSFLSLRQMFLAQLIETVVSEVRQRNLDGIDLSFAKIEPKLDKLSANSKYFTDLINSKYINTNQIVRPDVIAYERMLNQYYIDLLKIEDIRKKLISSANEIQKERMFNRELEVALINYGLGNYNLCSIQLEYVLSAYNYKEVDDVIFYKAESEYALKHFEQAKFWYEKLFKIYPNSEYTAKTIYRLIFISYVFDDLGTLNRYFSNFKNLSSKPPILQNKINYLVGVYFLQKSRYSEAIETLNSIPVTASTYLASQYGIGLAYSGRGDFENAMKYFSKIVASTIADRSLKNNAYLQLGFIYFEMKNFIKALDNFIKITDDFVHYDLALIGIMWSQFRMKNFSQVAKVDSFFVREYPTSDYIYEAKNIGAFLRQIEAKPEDALKEFEFVFDAQKAKAMWDRYIAERDSIIKLIRDIREIKEQAYLSSGQDFYIRAVESEYDFYKLLNALAKSQIYDRELIEQGKEEVRKIYVNLSELDRLEEIAKAREDKNAIRKIKDIRGNLFLLLASNPYIQNATTVYWKSVAKEEELEDLLNRLDAQQGYSGRAYENYREEAVKLMRGLDELDRLESIAKQKDDNRSIKKIQTLRSKVYKLLEQNSIVKDTTLKPNYFSDYTLAVGTSEIEKMNKRYDVVRKGSVEERTKINRQIVTLRKDIADAEEQKDYHRLVELRKESGDLENVAESFDEYQTNLFMSTLPVDETDLYKWTDFAAYGISNVNFAIKLQKTERIKQLQANIGQINKLLTDRKKDLDQRTNDLNVKLAQTIAEIREQERIRARKEREEKFQKEYFEYKGEEKAEKAKRAKKKKEEQQPQAQPQPETKEEKPKEKP